MLNIQQVAELNAYMTELTERIANTLRTKEVLRQYVKKTKNGVEFIDFYGNVKATGKLADSVEYEIGENEIKVLAFSYIEKLITGEPPGTMVPVFEMDNWLAVKELPWSLATVLTNYYEFGSSIYRKWKGADSGLLEEYVFENEVNPEIVQALIDRVEQYSIDYVTQQVLNNLKNAS